MLTGEKATLLATLYARAIESAAPDSVLHDTMAAHAIANLDYDFTKVGIRPKKDAIGVALRAWHLDNWTRDFLATHPAATVLHLGCGLDTRYYRVAPGPSVQWFDVDYPEVITLREQLYPPATGNYHLIGSSVTDPGLLARIPTGQPVLMVAEGLTMYLHPAEGTALIGQIVEHFGHGQLIFDALSRRGIKLQRYNKAIQAAGAKVFWGIDNPTELEEIDHRLRCTTALSAMDPTFPGPHLKKLSFGYRAFARLAMASRSLRNVAVFYRLDF
jgi:O-methyltransferase involved in polyketide biosynthesis